MNESWLVYIFTFIEYYKRSSPLMPENLRARV